MHDPMSSPLIPPAWPGDWPEIAEVFRQVLHDGSWGKYHGPHCERLEQALAEFHQVQHASLCSSGTAAVELALRGAGVNPGDEVILAAYDFKANFQNVLLLGATPVLIDVDEQSWQMNPDLLAAACSERTKAILVSHLRGAFAPRNAITNAAESRGLMVIEDACQATGAVLQGRRTGGIGHVGVLSFGGSKLLTAGRGGAVLTNDPAVAQRIQLYQQRGNAAYPLSELQAAVLLPQLQRLEERHQRRLAGARFLLRELRQRTQELRPLIPLDDIVGLENLLPPGEARPTELRQLIPELKPLLSVDDIDGTANSPAFYKLGFQLAPDVPGLTRDAYACRMRSRGVALDPGFSALHRTHSRRRFRAPGELPHAEAAHERCLVLHHPVLLEPESVLTQVAEALGRGTG